MITSKRKAFTYTSQDCSAWTEYLRQMASDARRDGLDPRIFLLASELMAKKYLELWAMDRSLFSGPVGEA